MKDWFEKEKKKEKIKLFKEGNKKQDVKINKDVKDVIKGAAAVLIGIKAVEVINS